MHRAQQIFDAAYELVSARVTASGVKVFKHHRQFLDEEQDELPAISVDYGTDDPADGTLGDYHSVITLETVAQASAPTAEELHEKLLELRAEIHIALRESPTLGLSFVMNTNYGPVDKPELNTRGELFSGALTSRWLIHYWMDLSDPN